MGTSIDIQHHIKIQAEYRGSCSSSEARIDHIYFNFSHEDIARDWLLLEDSTELIRDERYPIIISSCYLSRQQLLNSSSARKTIKNSLENWPVPADIIDEVITKALREATERVGQSAATKYNVLDMLVECTVEYDHTLEQDDETVLVVDMSLEESEYRTAPAADSVIESLKRKMIDSETNESCSICLEVIPSDCEALCTPCSHVFHGDCIRKWLRTSHYCPNCRYEMSTN